MRFFGSENLPEILGGVLHTDLPHGRLVLDVVHRPWPEMLKATLIVDRMSEHLSIVDHRAYDAAIRRFYKHVRPFIDDLRRITIGEPVVSQCVGRASAEHLAEVVASRTSAKRLERKQRRCSSE